MRLERYGFPDARQTRIMANVRWLAGALTMVAVVAACGNGNEAASTEAPAPSDEPLSEDPPPDDPEPVGPAFEVGAGTAVVEAGGERFEFVVFQCLVGDDAGPTRRVALSASDTEPYLDAGRFLNVNVLVSSVIDGHEEHVIEIFSVDDTLDVGAADLQLPSRGGPAPDDWVHVDGAAGVVYGSGFELQSTSPDDDTSFGDGVLVADCPTG